MMVLCELMVTGFMVGLCTEFISGLDFAAIDEENSSYLKDDTPIIVVQHGLSGGESG
jgi:hypothetical protein